MLKLKVVKTLSLDPNFNLALEETLLNSVLENEIILFLWQNDKTVVIGRNQNPWKECDIKGLELEGIKIARRISGGGAVYHDMGNLNFTFIATKNNYDVQKQIGVIIDSLESFGMVAEYSGRNDLLVLGKKFSGNAFYSNGIRYIHHGTLLIDGDLEKLTKYLKVSKEKMISKGIDSIRSRVINLKSLNMDITVQNAMDKIIEVFKQNYSSQGEKPEILYIDQLEFNIINFKDKFKESFEKYTSWNWIYGETPDFDIVYKNRFTWGDIELGFKLKNGYIDKVQIFSDSLFVQLIDKLKNNLKGSIFSVDSIIESILEINATLEEKNQIEDIVNWLSIK